MRVVTLVFVAAMATAAEKNQPNAVEEPKTSSETLSDCEVAVGATRVERTVKMTDYLTVADDMSIEAKKLVGSQLSEKNQFALNVILREAALNVWQHGRTSQSASFANASYRITKSNNELSVQVINKGSLPKSLNNRVVHPEDRIEIPPGERGAGTMNGFGTENMAYFLSECPPGATLFWQQVGPDVIFTLRIPLAGK